GIGHRPAALSRETVAEPVYPVDILGAFGEALVQDARAFVDQCQDAALDDFLVTHLTRCVAGFFGHFTGHHVGFRIMDCLAATRLVAIETMATLLAEPLHFTQAVVQPHNRLAAAQPGQLPRAPAQIHANHVIHAIRPHGHAKALQGLVHLPRSSAFQHHLTGLARIHGQHAVADAAVVVDSQHCFLAYLIDDPHATVLDEHIVCLTTLNLQT